ncbi:YbhB/YbcL family Raf kinase inhibitor-like protein [Trueperella bialowiezensis]|uniref:Putative kinase inhibitor protein n=1 Tax=Trueperella bialowiezensis TaxID=312285 RepID=A0A3S4Z3X8_9ACTO|nr:YbhB/YbcL family Raf kinase inhibitor-like protein [Trueperella bialowiezensis]VEI12360.1 putative kinase inhibitor protein [Trueperella bialowiezensis]
MNLQRPIAPDPYELLPEVPTFELTSSSLTDGGVMPDKHLGFKDNVSPALEWTGFPEETQGFVVTCFDPDAPTPSGYWHWTVLDLDSSTTSLDENAGKSDLFLPGSAVHVRNDANEPAYYGAAPPAGDHPHRYIFVVHALDVPTLDLDPETTTPATAAFNTIFHTIARARLTVTYQR